MRYRQIDLPISSDDLVLEVGSGDDPYPEASILVDKYLVDNTQREARLALIVDRPFVLADACFLPFKDKAFDFVIASHVLEHVDNPKMFISEIARVAKRGYIETPGILRERVFNWPYHKWYTQIKNKRLILTRKTPKGELTRNKVLKPLDLELLTFFEGTTLTNCSLEWRERVDCQINEAENRKFFYEVDSQLLYLLNKNKAKKTLFYFFWLIRKLYLRTYFLPYLRKLLAPYFLKTKRLRDRKIRKNINLARLYACPRCKQEIIKENGGFWCRKCRQNYPEAEKGIINFLIT